MRIQRFEYLISREVTFINLTADEDGWAVFKKPKWNLYNFTTEEEISFKSLTELLEYEIEGKKVKQYIDDLPDQLPETKLGGGRGASSGQLTFTFDSLGGHQSKTIDLPPALANTKIKSKTFEGALAEFRKKHILAGRDYAFEVDSDGYVHQYKQGGRSSVGIESRAKTRRGEQTMIIHNHPKHGEPAFSGADLISTSHDRKSKGIVASSVNHDYIFEKGTHFKSEAFVKAVKSAKLRGKDYNDSVDKWLRANQKKYGYTYTHKKYK